MGKAKALKIAGIISGILAVIWAIFDWGQSFVFWLKIKWKRSPVSIGIIGSADGPTVIYVSKGGQLLSLLIRILPLILAGASIACFLVRKRILTTQKGGNYGQS